MNRLILLTATLLCVLTARARILPQEVRDLDAAIEYCNSTPLAEVEGIWQFADNETSVLIARDEADPAKFVMRIIAADDARLLPGDIIGTMRITPDAGKFELTLRSGADFSKHDVKCFAALSSDANAITIRKPAVKFDFSPSMILSRFWRIMKVRFENPAADLPYGLIRIYPGEAATPHSIIYL